jgi:hypothetical protein
VVLGSLGLLLAVALGAAIWVGAFWVGAVRHAADSMDPAITATLASEGITLSAPSRTNVPITKDRAVAIAVNDFPNRKPDKSSAVIANVLVKPNPAYNCTCWVVSWLIGTGVPPPGGPAGRKPPASQFQSWMRYHVAFIDAQSGKSEFAEEGYFPVQPS